MIDLLFLSVEDLALEVEGDDEGLLELLTAEAERFLLGGGTVTLETWRGLSKASRAALARAGEDLRINQAAAIAIASSNPVAAAMSAAGMDEDDASVRSALMASGDRMEKGGEA